MRNESEWVYLPQSEERVVAKQIKERSKQDSAYQARMIDGSGLESGGGLSVGEAILCAYIDLDRLIGACAFTFEQMNQLKRQMDGFSLRDIAELDDCDFAGIERKFRNMVSRIVRQNDRQWMKAYAEKSVGNKMREKRENRESIKQGKETHCECIPDPIAQIIDENARIL